MSSKPNTNTNSLRYQILTTSKAILHLLKKVVSHSTKLYAGKKVNKLEAEKIDSKKLVPKSTQNIDNERLPKMSILSAVSAIAAGAACAIGAVATIAGLVTLATVTSPVVSIATLAAAFVAASIAAYTGTFGPKR